jgi:hypothetical protein
LGESLWFEGRKTLQTALGWILLVFVSGSGARIIGGNGNKIKNKITQN